MLNKKLLQKAPNTNFLMVKLVLVFMFLFTGLIGVARADHEQQLTSASLLTQENTPSTASPNTNRPIIPPDIEKILKRGVLRVAVLTNETSPFLERKPSGETTGYDIDMAKDIANHLGVKINFNFSAKSFNDLIKLIDMDEVDIATSITPTLPRAKFIAFSKPYALPNLVLFLNQADFAQAHIDIQQINNPKYHIGFLQDSAYYSLLKENYLHATAVPYTDLHQGLSDVISGKLFAFFMDQPHLKIWLHEHPQGNLYGQIMVLKEKSLPLTIATAWNNPNFLAWLNQYLEISTRNGTQANLMAKYFN